MRFRYQYPSEKLSQARRRLMLPHSKGEAASIAAAFGYCGSGIGHLSSEMLDNDARSWFNKITQLMSRPGTDLAKAESLSGSDKIELSNSVNELADWLMKASWQEFERENAASLPEAAQHGVRRTR